jgi:nitrite reductase/ring-hydroxylating ferredoxin subunit
VGAVGSALSGLTDWSDTHGKPQRVGALHGLLNITAAALYTGSYIARKNRSRGLGRALAFTGYGIVLASAWLGGALSYRQRIGVDHSPDADNELPEDFKLAIAESELVEGQPTKTTLDGTDIFLLKRGGQIFALANKCSHMGGPLNEGQIEGDGVICPWHGSRFCMKTGDVLDGPAVHPQPKLDVQVRDGQVLVRASQTTTGPKTD